MFEASCSHPVDTSTTACGLFGSSSESASSGFQSLTLEEFLEKLDLTEYKQKFNDAGIVNVEGLAHLTESDLDQFHLRKLEKRKLMHHLTKARASDSAASGGLSCTS